MRPTRFLTEDRPVFLEEMSSDLAQKHAHMNEFRFRRKLKVFQVRFL